MLYYSLSLLPSSPSPWIKQSKLFIHAWVSLVSLGWLSCNHRASSHKTLFFEIHHECFCSVKQTMIMRQCLALISIPIYSTFEWLLKFSISFISFALFSNIALAISEKLGFTCWSGYVHLCVYGSCNLHMLRNFLIEEVFQNGIIHYSKKHSYKNIKNKDLWNSLANVNSHLLF